MLYLKDILSPIVIVFTIITIGLILSKIKIFGISLDLSAVLIIAIIMGCLIAEYLPYINNNMFENNMSLLSKIGTALFVSSIGISSGNSFANNFKKSNIVYFFIGSAMVCISFVFANIISIIDTNIDKSILSGMLCGALTSTPGLSAICESIGINSENAIIGYGCTYIFGVIGVVLFVQIISKKSTTNTNTNIQVKNNNLTMPNIESLIYIGLSVILGYILGNISIVNSSLGASGGILCSSILIGLLISKCNKEKLNSSILTIYRNFGLVLFFAGSGLPAGLKLNSTFNLLWFIYGVILTIIPIIFGYILCRLIVHKSALETATTIAGGMTSTPAIGVLIRNQKLDPDLTIYSFTYIGALLSIIICTKIFL